MELPPLASGLDLLAIPGEIASRGYEALHICHFHLANRDGQYLDSVRFELDRHGIELDMLLIDDGDLSLPGSKAPIEWVHGWLDAAERLGAKRARVIAGKSSPTRERRALVGERLGELALQHPDVRIVTENFLAMTPDAASILQILDFSGDQVGLLIDLGNWRGAEKYGELRKIASIAESCHAKCHYSPSGPDEEDFRASLQILNEASYRGPICLIYDGPDDDEFGRLDDMWEMVERQLGAAE